MLVWYCHLCCLQVHCSSTPVARLDGPRESSIATQALQLRLTCWSLRGSTSRQIASCTSSRCIISSQDPYNPLPSLSLTPSFLSLLPPLSFLTLPSLNIFKCRRDFSTRAATGQMHRSAV